jgi:hypothetical protein
VPDTRSSRGVYGLRDDNDLPTLPYPLTLLDRVVLGILPWVGVEVRVQRR